MAEKPPEEGYISVVDEEPEIFELLKWDHPQQPTTHHKPPEPPQQKEKSQEKRVQKAREESDPFDLPDPSFLETYRLPKDLVRNLCVELTPVMPDSTKSIEFSIESKVLAALSFFASGKYQKTFGTKTDPSITQYFVSTAVMQVTEALNHTSIIKKFIHFPHLRNEREIVKSRFYLKYGFPNVVGCVDCTHVPLSKPDIDQKSYFNKSYHSKKVQIICDSSLNVMSVDTWPGSYSHDAILNNHPVKNDLQSLNNAGEQCWLVGGPHYTQKPYIMAPIPKITKKSPVSPEKNYTNMHSELHKTVLDTIKQLKSRWKCLQATSNKQFDPATVSMIVVACCVLHNICNRRGLPILPMTQTEERLEAMKQKVANGPISRKQAEDQNGLQIRASLVERLWSERRVVPEQCNGRKRMSKKDRLLEGYQNTQNVVMPLHQPLQQPQQPQQPPQQQPQQPQQPPQQQMLTHLHQNQMLQEDPSKRARVVMNNAPYALPVTSGWAHYPQH